MLVQHQATTLHESQHVKNKNSSLSPTVIGTEKGKGRTVCAAAVIKAISHTSTRGLLDGAASFLVSNLNVAASHTPDVKEDPLCEPQSSEGGYVLWC